MAMLLVGAFTFTSWNPLASHRPDLSRPQKAGGPTRQGTVNPYRHLRCRRTHASAVSPAARESAPACKTTVPSPRTLPVGSARCIYCSTGALRRRLRGSRLHPTRPSASRRRADPYARNSSQKIAQGSTSKNKATCIAGASLTPLLTLRASSCSVMSNHLLSCLHV